MLLPLGEAVREGGCVGQAPEQGRFPHAIAGGGARALVSLQRISCGDSPDQAGGWGTRLLLASELL